jgi:hypothetical protein
VATRRRRVDWSIILGPQVPVPQVVNRSAHGKLASLLSAFDEAGTEDFDKAEATGSPLTLTARVPPQKLENVLPLDLSIVDWPQ